MHDNQPALQPRGQEITEHSLRQRTSEVETVKGRAEFKGQQPPGFNRGKLEVNGKNSKPMQPRDEREQAMQNPNNAECARLSVLSNEVEINTMQNPCMARCSTMQKSHLPNSMQHEQDTYINPPFEPNSYDTNLNHGSLIGPSIKFTHTNGPRLSKDRKSVV